MKTQTRVLVTGVGGGVGQSIIKCFQDSDYQVIAADGETLGTGLYAAARAYRVPFAANPDFISRLLEICGHENCTLVFPGLDPELPALAGARSRFSEVGVTVIVSSPQVIEICDDKLETARFLARHNFPAPRTLPLTDLAQLELPLILKPRRGGARSRGVYLVRDAEELAFRRATLEQQNYIAQEFIAGDEYTCGTLNLDGACRGTILMRRILRDGDTYKAFVETNPALDEYLQRVANALQPFGACNFQLRVREGIPYIFEINARCSGTTYSRALAGFNEPRLIADYVLRSIEPQFTLQNIAVLRYWKELVVEPSRIAAMEQHGMIVGDGSCL